jgi:hypothetical protein
MKMKTIGLWIFAATVLLARPLLGQTDAAALEAVLHGKAFALRSYSADPVVKFTYLDGKLIPDPILLHGLGAFFTDTVRQRGSRILIEGQVETLVMDSGKVRLMGQIPMRIEVDIQSATPSVAIPQLQALLFFPTLKAALDGLPEFVADFLPFPSDGKLLPPACHCIHVFQDGKWIQVDLSDPKFKPPAVLKQNSNPALAQMAIDQKASGTIVLIYSVSETGHVDEVWLARPLGGSLDESAAKSGHADTFQPATLDGKPVGTVLIHPVPVN